MAKYALDGPLADRLASLSGAVSWHVQAGDRVLDLGCGTGELTRTLAAAGLRVAGCDISWQMLVRAARAGGAHYRDGCAGWVRLAPEWRSLPFASAVFDVVVAASVLEYVAEPAAVLRECARVLRPGGVILYTVPDLRHPVRWAEWCAQWLARMTWTPLGAVRRSSWSGYRAYLRASRQRHRVRWWLAASKSVGLRPASCPADGAPSALRLLVLRRADESPAFPADWTVGRSASKILYADLPEMLVWRQALRCGDLFVDVGANVGTYTIWAAECGAEVMALEPAADTFGLLLENVAVNGYQVEAIQATAGDRCGTARFTAGNSPDPNDPVETRLVTIDSLIGERHVAGMKVDVEGFEIDVLRGCTRALSERRIGLIQLEWNAMSQLALGADRRPVADLLAQHSYQLFRPDPQGRLVPVTDPGFGADVFARPAMRRPPGDIHR